MTEILSHFFSSVFGDNVWLATVLIAIVPLIELKGAIPFALSTELWGSLALGSWGAFGLAFLGSSLVVPIVALVFMPICEWLSKYKFFGAIINFFTGSAKSKSDDILQKTDKSVSAKTVLMKMFGVFLFVAFPVPLTGVWTGTCLGVLLGLNFWQICVSAILGNLVCGLIVTFVCMLFPGATTILLYVFLAIVLIALVVKLILHFVKKKSLKALEKKEE